MTTPEKPIPDRRKEDRGVSGRVSAIEGQLVKGAERMDKHEALLAENTNATKEVLEIVSMGRSFFKVLGHIGSGIKWLAGLTTAGGVLYSIWPHGTPPK